ncbi:MAG: hypothetical protein HY042_03180 [Spirochaetia bacterium]|nr:hypothetical protein [Spirochaetia bacterium]
MQNNTLSLFTTIYIFAAALIPGAIVFMAFYKGLKPSPSTAPSKRLVLFALTTTVLLYYALLGVLALRGALNDWSSFPPKALGPVLGLPLVFFVTLALLPATHRALAGISTGALIAFQSYRFLAEIMILLLVRESVMPETMTFTGRNFDIVTALTAPVADYLLFMKPVLSPRAARLTAAVWNIGGILILGNTIVTAMLLLPTPMQYFPTEKPFTAPALFPVYLLPGFLVPLAFAVHAFTLKRLLSAAPQTNGRSDLLRRSMMRFSRA